MKKRFLSLLLVMVMAMLPTQAFAAENSTDPFTRTDDGAKIISSQVMEYPELGFSITEEVDEFHRVIKTLEKNEISATDNTKTREISNARVEAENILLMLGMRQNNINMLTLEQLEFIAYSPKIQSTSSYTKMDELNNVTYLEPSVAYAEAERAMQEKMDIIETQLQETTLQTDITDLMENEIISEANAGGVYVYDDGIMNIIHLVAQNVYDPSRHLFMTDSLWLNMPSTRQTDSVGSVATSIAIDFNSASAWYSYDSTLINTSGVTYNNYTYNASVQQRVNGIYQGVGAAVKLPTDASIVDPYMVMFLTHSNYNAVVTYEAHVVNPQLATYFNSIGSYYHNGFGINIGNPSLSISLDKDGVAASIGLDITFVSTTRRHAPLLVYYQP